MSSEAASVTETYPSISLAELATKIGAQIDGDVDYPIAKPASLERATDSDISFFSDQRKRDALRETRAGAVIISPEHRELFAGNRLISDDPHLAFVEACHLLSRAARPVGNPIDSAAMVHLSAELGRDVHIGANAVVAANARLGDDVVVGANTVVGEYVSIGCRTRLAAGVIVYPGCHIGADCNIESGAVIGSPGFGYLENSGKWRAIPQIGSVRVGNSVDIGANTTIDRGALDDTIIEDGVKLDNQIQVAHNVSIGADTAIAGCTGIAGSARVGRRCKIGGRVSILGHLDIGDDVTIYATSVVTRSIAGGGTYSSNLTVYPASRWRRVLARLASLDELFGRVRRLERFMEKQSTRYRE
ncbi:MAG: UDP-3-O-(3-hydroxymyristoyl)glucosamine N-acyltransferase [Proteobacteria bacterium]|nr:MAG: UDP-3-O-(3-hydroxymyristoyl)glucosamine N-acyltransferase [Pseudomonadota bacterium]